MKASHHQGTDNASKSATDLHKLNLGSRGKGHGHSCYDPSKFSTLVDNEMRVKTKVSIYAAGILWNHFSF